MANPRKAKEAFLKAKYYAFERDNQTPANVGYRDELEKKYLAAMNAVYDHKVGSNDSNDLRLTRPEFVQRLRELIRDQLSAGDIPDKPPGA